jgi:hypothetical protein
MMGGENTEAPTKLLANAAASAAGCAETAPGAPRSSRGSAGSGLMLKIQ